MKALLTLRTKIVGGTIAFFFCLSCMGCSVWQVWPDGSPLPRKSARELKEIEKLASQDPFPSPADVGMSESAEVK
ncbi:MAG: hypothetical protein RH917_02515 [Lacipirellulaceae bacterium]